MGDASGIKELWRHCLDVRTALLNGEADSRDVERAYLLGIALAGAGSALVLLAIVGLSQL